MKAVAGPALPRRDFLKLAGAAGVCGLSPGPFASGTGRVSLVVDPANAAASSGPARKAAAQLQRALADKAVPCEIVRSVSEAAGASFCVLVAAAGSQLASGFPARAPLKSAESLQLAPGHVAGISAVLVSANDVRGFVYGLLELAERVQFGQNPLSALHFTHIVEEKPANELRCVGRYYCSELEDMPWYRDKAFWTGYLDRLVASRFNRFTLAFGLAYDFPRGVTDDSFHFVYPYLVDVPGYPDVRVMQLASPDGSRLAVPKPLDSAERGRNMEMLRYIAAETGARGLQFQLGIWTHAYQWTDSPNAYHRIEGLTPETHARYCRDALAIILEQCPEIQGLTMRVHGESGIPEGSYSFWRTVFEAIAGAGRTIEIDMHAKGVDEEIINIAVATGMPVKLGAKYSAEHQSLGYNQADIRALEIPSGNLSKTNAALFRVSSGARSFTRYGFADFLRAGAPYRLWFRLWPGTQRHLLSVDPEMAAAYGRTASFCGAAGLDLMEPLTFKGREGSGLPGGRCAYAESSLTPQADWQKYDLYYRVWGRKLYNPDADPETWQRAMRPHFGAGAAATEASLANASRILPLLTSAHLPSASNHDLWYELPTNMPVVLGSEPSPYGDTPTPKCFGTVSPLDPQMFSTVVEYARTLTSHTANPKYSPIHVAQWVEDCVEAARVSLEQARRTVNSPSRAEFRRIEEDVLIQIGLGTFFAHKLRSAVLYEIFVDSGDPEAGRLAVAHYQAARDAWAAMAQRARGVYRASISYGSIPKRSGHWSDRLPGIDADLSAMKAGVKADAGVQRSRRSAADEIRAATARPHTARHECAHTPPKTFSPGQALALSLSVSGAEQSASVRAVRLRYRHVNQAERWKAADATGAGNAYTAEIPAAYTGSAYPLEYYFELESQSGAAWMFPGLNRTLSNQPYFAVQQKGKTA
ncbi:MAG: twin-arginine translocation signal domain-containing protein [Acidobacteriota bacterium]|nr:twin-arginine translocation signal domain-containing protein [Acidobacteriota bacterium]